MGEIMRYLSWFVLLSMFWLAFWWCKFVGVANGGLIERCSVGLKFWLGCFVFGCGVSLWGVFC